MTSGWTLLLLTVITLAILNLAEAEVPTVFIFGDSTADVGTNNHLKSLSRADNPYNGIDFYLSKPTGRFSNGLNTADFIVRLLGGRKSPPPFLSLLTRPWSFKRNILLGANFASGGSGIFKHTGKKRFKEVIPLEQQIQQFATVRENNSETLDAVKAEIILSKALYVISVGSNDLFEYQLFNSTVYPEKLINDLMDTYAIHLQKLYKLGARKFGIISVPPIGCCPAERAATPTGGCIQEMNELALAFHVSTQALLQKFSLDFQGVQYSLGNSYQMTLNIIHNPLGNGFKDIKTACCGNGTLNGQSKCEKGAKLCSDRNDYLFWDRFHPTQAASKLAALTFLYAEGSEYVTPMNFSRLATA